MEADRHSDERSKILLVDDEEDMRLMIGAVIESNGYLLETAIDGADALAKVHDFQPDLILLDAVMPNVGGHEVCARIQGDLQTARTPVIFVTALDAEHDKARAFAVGAVDYVVKPIDPGHLIGKLNVHLKTAARWRRLRAVGTSAGDARSSPDLRSFTEFLAEQMDLDEHDRERLGDASSEDLYFLSGVLGIPPEKVARSIASFFDVRYLPRIPAAQIELGILPAHFCRSHQLVPLGTSSERIALSNPFDLQLLDTLRNEGYLTSPSHMAIAAPDTISSLFDGTPRTEMAADTSRGEGARPERRTRATVNEPSGNESSVVTLVDALISKAVRSGATNLHLQPTKTHLAVRIRVDSELRDEKPIEKALEGMLVGRVKNMASLDPAEREKPQNGRLRVRHQGETVDFRVATLPALQGESLVLQTIPAPNLCIEVESLGLDRQAQGLLDDGIRKSSGLILVAGPTDSGKTTTLYAALKAIDRPERNIITVEDTVGHEFDRITQVQIQPSNGLTFPVVLRHVARRDPDVVMVSELPDRETTELAFRSALDGHLVLSAIHANDVPSAITHLTSMGVAPYLVSSGLELVVAQRLLRKLCFHCRKPTGLPAEALSNIEELAPDAFDFHEAGACNECANTGYHGRLLVAEVLSVDEGLRELITERAPRDQVEAYLRERTDMRPMVMDALGKAAQGLTSVEEVLQFFPLPTSGPTAPVAAR